MKKKVLITSMGGSKNVYEFLSAFESVENIELYVCDSNKDSIGKNLTENFFVLPSGKDENYCVRLLEKLIEFKIDMVIPCSDEEAFSLMNNISLFENQGIVVAVQNPKMFKHLESKTSMYEYLKKYDIKLPNYKSIMNKNDLIKYCSEFNLNEKLLLIKPVQERGGRNIFVLSHTHTELKENLLNVTLNEFIDDYYDESREYVLMDYIEGVVYDIDILKYQNGDVYFGSRKRLTNVTKDFSGNIFDFDENIIEYAKKIYECFPTTFLLDYDLIVTENKEVHLLEVNPRPSGSLISYLPFSINLFEILIRSYLFNEHIPIKNLDTQKALVFNKIVKV